MGKLLDFSPEDRFENLRRISTVSRMLNDSGKNVIASFVSPMDLSFSEGDRTENIRRVSTVCKVLNDSGKNVIASFISPTENTS